MCTSTWPKSASQHIEVDGPRVIHVEAHRFCRSSTTRPESPIGPSAGARSAMIITSRSPFGLADRCLTESVVSKNR